MIKDHSFFLSGNRTGILLIHGLTGTPNEMRGIARTFHQAGYSVSGVQLAGHCGDVQDLVNSRWEDWFASVTAAAEKLKQHTDEIFVAGLSMGALLALKYASAYPVAGVIGYSPTFQYDGWSIPLWSKLLAPIVLPSVHYLNICRDNTFDEAEPYGIKNKVLRSRIVQSMNSGESGEAGLPGNPWHSLFQLQRLSRNVRKNLTNITAPCLLLHAYDDDISHRNNSQLVYDKVKGPKRLIWLYNSYHMITIDNDRKQVIEESLHFIQQYQRQHNSTSKSHSASQEFTSPPIKVGVLV
ncbi:carboxylesterase [Acinetobacter colistiniresistens]|uniref:Alpha/beta fold hydrolase n=1 Tax=Acinetobacter colistiniresistens TaxID=280145 RepID=S3TRF9_9GAMM|nr:alpha/beta fold hydrolase [Acinetobacter colistiniresistens]EPG38240.1 carboxylesterase [Acinetobacter colistiniresistens]TVT79698.1 alpha/beta fold hydrolase [Acinetobacter colistiniresistens]